MLVQVGAEDARNILRYVATDAALFLGHTTAVNDTATRGPRSCNAANF